MNHPRRVIDTSAYVAFRRGEPSLLNVIRQSQRLYLSSIVIGELLFGFRLGNRRAENELHLRDFLDSPFVEHVAVTQATAERYASLAESLRHKGTPVPTNDIWIAAQALELNAQVLTYDQHFEHMSEAVDVLRLNPSAS